MSAILAGAALRQELKKIAAAKDATNLPPEQKESNWEKTYLDWVFCGTPEKPRNSIIGDDYYALTINDFAAPEEFVEEFRKANEKSTRSQVKEIRKQLRPAVEARLENKKFDKWLGAALLAELNQLLEQGDLSGISVSLPNDAEHLTENSDNTLKKAVQNRRLLQAAFPDAIKPPSGASKKEGELDGKSVKVKRLVQSLKEAAKAAVDEKRFTDPRVQIYRMLSQPLRHALQEKSEIEMLIDELNRLLHETSLFGDSSKSLKETAGATASSPKDESVKTDAGASGGAANETELENRYLHEDGLSQVAKNRLRLQMVFPIQIGKVWDSLPVVYAWIDAQKEPHSALCLSGGGIRSATFALGILQGLAATNVLQKFDYLSTVSGGGYIGGWLSAWSRQSGGLESVREGLTQRGSDPLKPEPPQLRHLREYSNYLTPKLGLTSADTWTLIGTYIRNLALNWVVFLPAIAALLALPRIWVAVLQIKVGLATASVLLGIGAVMGISAIVYAALNRPSLGAPRNAVRGTGKFLIFCLGPLCVSAFCLTAFWAWWQKGLEGMPRNLSPNLEPRLIPFLVLGLALHVLAWGAYLLRLKRYQFRELAVCVVTGMLSGFFLWIGAMAWHTDFVSAPVLEWYVCWGIPYYLLSFALGVFLFVGIASRFTEDMDREWWARMGAWILLAAAVWGLFSTLVLFGPEWLLKLPRLLTALGGVTGVITLVLSHSGATPANKKEKVEMGKKAIPTNLILGIAAPLFVAVFITALSLGTAWLVTKVPVPHIHIECDGATLLSEQDIKDLPFLAARLKEHEEKDAASRYLWTGLTAALQSQLTNYDSSEAQTKALRTSLTEELNAVIRTNRLSTNSALLPVDLSPAIKDALAQDVRGQRQMQRNRYILDRAYSRELASGRFDHRMITHECHWLKILLLTTVLIATSFILSRAIDINRFSLHAVYRNRLIRAYLGASNPRRRPNAFTGFDPADNLYMADLNHRPFLVVNTALNLVTGENLAWQQRKAESFTASPLHAGNYRLGFRKVQEYGCRATDPSGWRKVEAERAGRKQTKEDGLTLGTVVTISGAAASPNMGYHSSPVLAVLMTLFNVRLGAWLGNPGKAGDDSYKDGCPRSAFWHLVMEALGWTDDKAKYVYLSDGGHFENLGLYEMVLRRCRRIVVSDAGCDPKCALEDLGNAIRKIRIDLGIPIKIHEEFRIFSRGTNLSSKYCVRAVIQYTAVGGAHDGELLYIKPAISGDEPKDVYNYKESTSLFPHEPTSDQWFSESQFESYRMLGEHILRTIWNGNDEAEKKAEQDDLTATSTATALEYLFKAADCYLKKPLPDAPNLSARKGT